MKNFIKKYIGEMMIILGSGLSSYNIFNFSYQTYGREGGGLLPSMKILSTIELEGIAYYYSSLSLILISIGVALIVSGVLIIKQKDKNK